MKNILKYCRKKENINLNETISWLFDLISAINSNNTRHFPERQNGKRFIRGDVALNQQRQRR